MYCSLSLYSISPSPSLPLSLFPSFFLFIVQLLYFILHSFIIIIIIMLISIHFGPSFFHTYYLFYLCVCVYQSLPECVLNLYIGGVLNNGCYNLWFPGSFYLKEYVGHLPLNAWLQSLT